MREAIPAAEYCEALLTWARVASRSPEEVEIIQSASRVLLERHPGDAIISELCEELAAWAEAHPDPGAVHALERDIRKSCLLDRLIYAGEPLRTRPCPIHKGQWGCWETCPAGCNFGMNLTGWLPE